MSNTLTQGAQLTGNSPLTNGSYRLSIVDGTLFLKKNSTNLWLMPNPALQPPVPGSFCIILDGVVQIKKPNNQVIASFGAGGHPQASLILQANGNLVIQDVNGAVIWSSNTAQAAA